MLAIRNQESRAIMEWLRFQHFSMHGRWPTQSLPSAGWLSMPWWFPPCFSLARLAQCSLSSAEHPVEGFLLSPSRREKKCGWVLDKLKRFSPSRDNDWFLAVSSHEKTDSRWMWNQNAKKILCVEILCLSHRERNFKTRKRDEKVLAPS